MDVEVATREQRLPLLRVVEFRNGVKQQSLLTGKSFFHIENALLLLNQLLSHHHNQLIWEQLQTVRSSSQPGVPSTEAQS